MDKGWKNPKPKRIEQELKRGLRSLFTNQCCQLQHVSFTSPHLLKYQSVEFKPRKTTGI
jgi:hypothetical protein